MTTLVDADLPLALYDYVPVALTAGAAWLLGERLGRRQGCRLAASALLVGGTMKASWKLLLATQHRDHGLLFHGLFPWLALGFALLIRALDARIGARWAVIVAVAEVAAAVLRDDAVLLAATAVGTLLTAGLLARRAPGPSRTLAILWAVASSALSPLAAHVQTTGLAWVEQTLNSAAQGLLLLAVVLLPAAQVVPAQDKELVS